MKAETLEEYYWNSPKWFSTVIPMIWFAYKGVFSIDKDFYNQNVKRLYKDNEKNSLFIQGLHDVIKNAADGYINAILIFATRVLQEIDGEPICRYENVLRWRFTSHLLEEDMSPLEYREKWEK